MAKLKRFNVALLQLDIQKGEVETNFKKIKSYIPKLAKKNIKIVSLPELWPTGFVRTRLSKMAEETREALEWMAELSAKYEMVIVGSGIEEEDGKFYNSAHVIDSGKILGFYRKVHLFSPIKEDSVFTPGNEAKVFDTSVAKIGVVICYDLRFPELIRKVMKLGAEVLIVPAQWPEDRINHWHILLQARAIENQFFVIGVNRIGEVRIDSGGTIIYSGHSMIIDPWGEIISQAGDREGFRTAKFDMTKLEKIRNKFPFLNDIRDIY